MCRSWLGGGAARVSRALICLLSRQSVPLYICYGAKASLQPLECVDTLALAATKKRALPLNASLITRLELAVVAVIAAPHASAEALRPSLQQLELLTPPQQQPFER